VLVKGAWRNATYGLLLVSALYFSGCASQQAQQKPATPGVLGADKSSQANDILFNALGLVGTPYRYGGSSPDNGFDCSGLIQYVYRESADVALPRTVAEMNNHEAPDITEDNLQSGDLVIFATDGGSRPSHAGIYVGEGRFVHAPSSGGEVRMDFLDDKYWQRSYLNAKRPLDCR
jgi:cell wall-associated NlpC family hydrolase